MALPPAPWDVVLGNTPGGELIVVPGPQGEQGIPGIPGVAGAPGIQGPVGPVAAPLAKYILDTADAGLVNGIAVHRALGPDRVPTVPNAMDDEMTDAVHGFNPALWVAGTWPISVPVLDPVGGMQVAVGESDSGFYLIEQAFAFGASWAFTAKVAVNAGNVVGNRRYVGISLRNPGLSRIEFVGIGQRSQVAEVLYSKYNTGPTAEVSNTLLSVDPTEWIYIRVRGNTTTVISEYSKNGLTFRQIDSQGFYTVAPTRIGLFTMSNQLEAWSAYVQWFRRTA